MGKPNGGHDVTITQSNGNLIISSSHPSNGNLVCCLQMNAVKKTELEVHHMNNSPNYQATMIKTEMSSTSAFNNNPHVKVEPTFRRHEPSSRLTQRGSNKKIKRSKKRDSKLPRSQQELANHGSTAKYESGHDELELILMSCLNCYMHVMVCEANPFCPKCHRGDCFYRG